MDDCEDPISNFLIDNDAANVLLNNTSQADNTEGVFQILDTFSYLTPMLRNCYHMGLGIRDSSVDLYKNDELQYDAIAANIGAELFYIVSNIFTQVANEFYEDWYSFSYYVGDMGYRILLSDALNRS